MADGVAKALARQVAGVFVWNAVFFQAVRLEVEVRLELLTDLRVAIAPPPVTPGLASWS